MTTAPPQLDAPPVEAARRAWTEFKSSSGSSGGFGFAFRVFFVVSRFAFGAFLLLTSAYCLLMYIPFTYFGFIQHPLLAWLPVFVRIHADLFAILLAGVVATLWPALRDAKTRRATAGFVAIHAGVAAYMLFRPALPGMERDLFAYVWSMLCLFPLLWLAALDLSGHGAARKESAPSRQWNLATTTLAAITIAGAFALSAALSRAPHESTLLPGADLHGVAASLVFHLVIFTAFGGAMVLIGVIARRTPWSESVRWMGTHAVAVLICAGVIHSLILPTLSFDGPQANLFSGVVSLALVLYAAGCAAAWRRLPGDNAVTKRIGLKANGIGRWRMAGLLIAGALGLLLFSYAIPSLLRTRDWDFALQRTAVVVLWAAALAFLRWTGVELKARTARAATLLILALAVAGCGVYRAEADYHPGVQDNWTGLLDSYAGTDLSFKTAYDILSRSVDNQAHEAFYQFLKRNTNIPPETVATPSDVSLVPDLKPTPGEKPNIFLFVIDSLRQDYVSAYNPAVDFTPQIGKFAQDSVVMQNAFTRYAGTALSEPAIWVGAMQLHMQYLQPFYPMNNLQKLLDTDGYESYISVDPILQAILRPSSSIVKLDKNRTFWEDLDFVPTLKELETKIDARPDKSKPIFAYTQPQNVHTLTLDRLRGGRSRREISIQEMRRMDTAFGEFVDFLKSRGLYDNSIIILTSDHGDAYGEFGRYGHSDFIFPEVVKIPLIIHLPPRLKKQVAYDPHQLAFSLDITPSLYYLLGHRPTLNRELFGRPLFTQRLDEQTPYVRPQYLIVSSYGPVYGLLQHNATSFFIVDAVNRRNYFYDLTADPEGIHNHLTRRIRDEGESEIRRQVGLIQDLYHDKP